MAVTADEVRELELAETEAQAVNLATEMRGGFMQLRTRLDVRLPRCVLKRGPYPGKNKKPYVKVAIADDVAAMHANARGMAIVRRIDEFARRVFHAKYTPFDPERGTLVVKVPASRRVVHDINQFVDIVIRPGSFGSHGYFWSLESMHDPEGSQKSEKKTMANATSTDDIVDPKGSSVVSLPAAIL